MHESSSAFAPGMTNSRLTSRSAFSSGRSIPTSVLGDMPIAAVSSHRRMASRSPDTSNQSVTPRLIDVGPQHGLLEAVHLIAVEAMQDEPAFGGAGLPPTLAHSMRLR